MIYTADAVANDARYPDQYAHRLTEAERAWDLTTGDRGPRDPVSLGHELAEHRHQLPGPGDYLLVAKLAGKASSPVVFRLEN
mgnify:CR=1 FL=1